MSQSPSHQLVDLGFLDARAKVIDLAAFLDRAGRHGEEADYRIGALHKALAELSAPGPPHDRARRVLEAFSDPTADPIPAAHTKGAAGAWDPSVS
ncbi:MAG TPA: hypothetical protein VMN36_04545 [Verrucomicrobiales bacterium]|nr:hypothetical protein [Verrucomicrobiales bacterium]